MPAPLLLPTDRTGLLVSVRDAREAGAALQGGADVIDVKEPARGPLGRADAATVARVVAAAAHRRPVTAAAGDWGDLTPIELADWSHETEAEVVKIGLPNGLTKEAGDGLRETTQLLSKGKLAPVLYADRMPGSPPGAEALEYIVESLQCDWLVLDTCDKMRGDLLDSWSLDMISSLLTEARRHGLHVALAGGLDGQRLQRAAGLGPDVVGVRGAACDSGRHSCVCPGRVAKVRRLIALREVPASRESPEKT